MPELLACPDCPLCGHPPEFILTGNVQAFCSNAAREAMCWNPSRTAAENRRGLVETQWKVGRTDG
jgi:hypothetical protein